MTVSHRLATYFKEIAFARSRAVDAQSFTALVWSTLRFHARNALHRPVNYNHTLTIRLGFGPRQRYELSLRPFAGDLFVLYEILLHNSYYMPDEALPPQDARVIVDCGGNIGITALYLATRYPNATIYSIEPHPDTFAILKRNTAAEPRIVPVHAAVVGKPMATAKLTFRNPAWGNRLTQDGLGLEVPATTLYQLIQRFRLTRIDFLKVDIEGAEEMVFAHGEFLPYVRLGMIELHGQYTRSRLDADLSNWGFSSTSPTPGDGPKMLTFAQAETAPRILRSVSEGRR
jgi:FkbM family methyltransferase